MAFMLASVAVAAIAGAAAATALWLRRRYVLVTIQGGSMQPTFHPGDRVLVRRTPLAAIHNGAVVVVEQPILGLPPGETARRRGAAHLGLDRLWMIKRAAAVPGSPLPDELASAATPPIVLGTWCGTRARPRLAMAGSDATEPGERCL